MYVSYQIAILKVQSSNVYILDIKTMIFNSFTIMIINNFIIYYTVSIKLITISKNLSLIIYDLLQYLNQFMFFINKWSSLSDKQFCYTNAIKRK